MLFGDVGALILSISIAVSHLKVHLCYMSVTRPAAVILVVIFTLEDVTKRHSAVSIERAARTKPIRSSFSVMGL
jgi:hypothetical protein